MFSEQNEIIHSSLYKTIANKLRPTIGSFFSGFGGLDYAFKKLGYEGIFALDKKFYKDTSSNRKKYGSENCSVLEDHHIKTFKKNIGNYIVAADFLEYPIENIPDFEVGLFSIPCVELSSVSPNRNRFKMLPKFIDRFIEIMKAKKNSCKIFVLENSSNILSAGREFIEKIRKELPWYKISENDVDAADFGSAQHRQRVIIIGSTIGEIKLEKPKVREITTVGMAFKGLNDTIPNQMEYAKSNAETKLRMSYIPQGGNYKDVPKGLQTKGRFSNYMRRLSLNDISIAICNISKSLITHPTENRVLSVRECLRLFDIDDSFIPEGTLSSKFQMICNSVPLKLGQAIAKVIKEKLIKYKYKEGAVS